MNGGMRILVVEDDEVDRLALRRTLARSGMSVVLVEAETLADAHMLLDSEAPDAIISDYVLPDGSAIDLVRELRIRSPELPIIVLTGQGDERVAVELMKAGAADYLPKNSATPRRLRKVLRSAVRVAYAERLARAAQLQQARLFAELGRERERLERAVAERDEVLAIVSHDLRSPLSSVSMALEDLADGAAVGPERHRVIGIAQRAVGRMVRLIEDLLDVSRIEKGALSLEIGDYDAAQIALDAVDTMRLAAERERIVFATEISEDLGLVRVDRARIAQVLQNLLSNALKFTPGGGTIRVRAMSSENAVQYEVHDDGPGVPMHLRPFVFERFWQARHGDRSGAGLGLAIVKGIVEAHGGRVGLLDSDRGARFAFALPRADHRHQSQ